MYRLCVLPRRVDPCLKHLKDEEVVLRHQALINHPAFKIRITLADERNCDSGGGQGSEAKCPGFADLASRAVPAIHSLFRQLQCRDVDHAFLGRLQDVERVVPIADYATYGRGLELHHRMPRHGHDVRLPRSGCYHHHNRPQFEQAINFGQWEGFFVM